MRLLIEKIIRRIYTGLLYPYTKISYSQNGEDLIIKDLFHRLNISCPSYLDIGANEPFKISNSYLLYSKGSKGVCIEPNPLLHRKLSKKRSRDICINAGIAFDEQKEADFYLFPGEANGLSTFSKQDAEFWQSIGNQRIGKHKIEKIIRIPLLNINEIMSEYFNSHPNLISLDVEGLDFEILKTIDFKKFQPEVLCIETLSYEPAEIERKNQQIVDFLVSKGYELFADTYINSIFCRSELIRH
jgi:FkbM family methyltransferase